MTKTAVITGITGQDGAYMARHLLQQDYTVYGAHRRTSSTNFWRIEELGVADHQRLHLVDHDLTDLGSSIRLIEQCQPDEVYNLGAQSFVAASFNQPNTTAQIDGLGALNMLEAIRLVNKEVRFYQASTSELYGLVQEVPQSETTPFYPRSPYAVAKLYGHWITINYRESYDMFAACGILFNHESPLRGMNFVTRKITNSLAQIVRGKLDCLELGNLDAKRDWGYADEYVKGMHMMLTAEQPDTFVLATGRTETVRDFVNMAFKAGGITLDWQGSGINEKGIDQATGRELVRVNEAFYRPAEVDLLIGDASKAQAQLGWKAEVSLESMCQMMVDADLQRVDRGFYF